MSLIGVCSDIHFAIVLEFMENGSLEKLVFKQSVELQPALLLGIVKDISAGVKNISLFSNFYFFSIFLFSKFKYILLFIFDRFITYIQRRLFIVILHVEIFYWMEDIMLKLLILD